MASVKTGTELKLSRRFDAPRAKVWEAWTDPDVLTQWWAAAPHWDSPFAEVDLRPGGKYRLAMHDPDSDAVHVVAGTYTEVSPPERLAFTWHWEEENPNTVGSEDTQVVIELREDGDGTELTLTHGIFANAEIRDKHAHGWEGCLASLESRVFASH